MSHYVDNPKPRVCIAFVGNFRFWLVIRPGRSWIFATTWREAIQTALDWHSRPPTP